MDPSPMPDGNNRDYALRILARRNNKMEGLIKFGELRQVIELKEVQSPFPLVNLQIGPPSIAK